MKHDKEKALVKNTAVLLVDFPDQKGLVASIAEFLYRIAAVSCT